MPIRSTTIAVPKEVYTCTCLERPCKKWVRTYTLKRNAECAMLGHRILAHGYIKRPLIGNGYRGRVMQASERR